MRALRGILAVAVLWAAAAPCPPGPSSAAPPPGHRAAHSLAGPPGHAMARHVNDHRSGRGVEHTLAAPCPCGCQKGSRAAGRSGPLGFALAFAGAGLPARPDAAAPAASSPIGAEAPDLPIDPVPI